MESLSPIIRLIVPNRFRGMRECRSSSSETAPCADANCPVGFIGDYFGLAVSGGNIYALFVSTHYPSGVTADGGGPCTTSSRCPRPSRARSSAPASEHGQPRQVQHRQPMHVRHGSFPTPPHRSGHVQHLAGGSGAQAPDQVKSLSVTNLSIIQFWLTLSARCASSRK